MLKGIQKLEEKDGVMVLVSAMCARNSELLLFFCC